jgi:hypothetical protein
MNIDQGLLSGNRRAKNNSFYQVAKTKSEPCQAAVADKFVPSSGQPREAKPALGARLFRKATPFLVAAATVGAVAATAAATPALSLLTAGLQAGGAQALKGGLIGLAVAGIPTLGMMGLPGAVIGAGVGITLAAGLSVAAGAGAGLAGLTLAACAGGSGAAYLLNKANNHLGADRSGPIFRLGKNLPKNTKVNTFKTSTLEYERPQLEVEMATFQVDPWLKSQGAEKDDTGKYLLSGVKIESFEANKPDWSSTDWTRVRITPLEVNKSESA